MSGWHGLGSGRGNCSVTGPVGYNVVTVLAPYTSKILFGTVIGSLVPSEVQ
jgi:hypothetical protein